MEFQNNPLANKLKRIKIELDQKKQDNINKNKLKKENK